MNSNDPENISCTFTFNGNIDSQQLGGTKKSIWHHKSQLRACYQPIGCFYILIYLLCVVLCRNTKTFKATRDYRRTLCKFTICRSFRTFAIKNICSTSKKDTQTDSLFTWFTSFHRFWNFLLNALYWKRFCFWLTTNIVLLFNLNSEICQ